MENNVCSLSTWERVGVKAYGHGLIPGVLPKVEGEKLSAYLLMRAIPQAWMIALITSAVMFVPGLTGVKKPPLAGVEV